MGVNLIKRIHCVDLIKSTVAPLVSDIVEDGTSHDLLDIDTERDCWLACYVDGDYCGLFQVAAYNRTTLDMHCYIIKSKRSSSRECGIMAVRWVKENSPDIYKKIITQVPSIYPHIKRYVERLGFTLEGTYTSSFTKNGELHDLWLFGQDRG